MNAETAAVRAVYAAFVVNGFAFASWASKARRAIETAPTPAGGGGKKRLAFVVSVEGASMRGDGRPRVVITPHAVTLRKDGSPGKAMPFNRLVDQARKDHYREVDAKRERDASRRRHPARGGEGHSRA